MTVRHKAVTTLRLAALEQLVLAAKTYALPYGAGLVMVGTRVYIERR